MDTRLITKNLNTVDKAFEKKKWTPKKMTIVIVTAVVVLNAASYYLTSGKSKLNVDLERITISEVSN